MDCCGARRPHRSTAAATQPAALLAYAAALQRRLDTRVELVGFFSGGGGGPELAAPCALRAVLPFTAGGSSRLLLNRASPVVQGVAALLASSSAAGDSAAASGRLLQRHLPCAAASAATGRLILPVQRRWNSAGRWSTPLPTRSKVGQPNPCRGLLLSPQLGTDQPDPSLTAAAAWPSP